MTHQEYAQSLRSNPERHYNCCQSVLIPFAEDAGLDAATACRLTEHFGSGMRRGAACGAAVGGLLALGLLGKGEQDTARTFNRMFKERAGAMDCAVLLKEAVERGEERKPHCDRMVQIAVELVEELSREEA